MFIGHLGAGPAIKKLNPKTNLGWSTMVGSVGMILFLVVITKLLSLISNE